MAHACPPPASPLNMHLQLKLFLALLCPLVLPILLLLPLSRNGSLAGFRYCCRLLPSTSASVRVDHPLLLNVLKSRSLRCFPLQSKQKKKVSGLKESF